MSRTITMMAGDIRELPRQGRVGDPVYGNYLNEHVWATNIVPATQQVGTATITGATDSITYSVVINGITVSINSGTGATTTSIAAALATAINGEPAVRAHVEASANAAVVTITALIAGTSFTLTDTDANITTVQAATANDAADDVPVGRLVIALTRDSNGDLAGQLAKSTAFTAQADAFVLTYDAAVIVRATIVMEGETYSAEHTMATDLDTSGTALAAALEAIFPANTVAATWSTDTLTLTSEVAGKPFTSSISFGPGRDTGAAVKTSNAGQATDVTKAAKGVSLFPTDEEVTTVGGSEVVYPGGAGVKALKKGVIWVESAQSIAQGDSVYVELDGSGSDAGKFFNTTSATRALLPGWSWERDAASYETESIAALVAAA